MSRYLKENRKLAILGSATAILLVVIILCGLILGNIKRSGDAVYVKENGLFYTSLSDSEPWQVADEIVSAGSMNNQELAGVSTLLNSSVKLSGNGNRIFYMQGMNSGSGMSLCYRDVKEKGASKEVASSVQSFEVNEKGTLVTYLKTQNGELYQYDLKEERKVASGVEKYFVAKDGKNIVYKTLSGDVYRQRGENKKEKIATGVKTLICVYENGSMYYAKAETKARTLLDYVDDDMKKQDKELTKPEQPQCPFMWEYDSEEEYQKAYEKFVKKYEDYQKKQEAYQAKMHRDVLRQELKSEKLESSVFELCYHNGRKERVVTENAIGFKANATEKAALIYSACESEKIEKIKISEMNSLAGIRERAKQVFDSGAAYYLATKSRTSEIKQENAEHFSIDSEGKTIYIIDHISAKSGEGELYKLKVSNKKVGKAKKIDDKVYMYSASLQEDCYTYYRNVRQEENIGDLYMDGKCLDTNVRIGTVSCLSGDIVYLTEWDKDSKCGILKLHNGKKSQIMNEKVHAYSQLPKGDIVCICNYDGEEYTGELYIYKQKKAQKVDEGVVALIGTNIRK